jgi:hypothetical protein
MLKGGNLLTVCSINSYIFRFKKKIQKKG